MTEAAALRYLTVDEYVLRAGAAVPHVEGSTDVDRTRIEAALDDASGEIRAWLTEDLLAGDGTPVKPPPRLVGVLRGITFDLARHALSDGATGAEEGVTQRFQAARKLLRELKGEPERPTVNAALVEGAAQWIPGATPEDAR